MSLFASFRVTLQAATAFVSEQSLRQRPETYILRPWRPLVSNKRPSSSIAARLKSFRFQKPQKRLYTDQSKSQARPSPDPTPNLGSPQPEPPALSLSQRFKKLTREYGWSAMGVYFTLSALDFPFCFAAVRLVGPDRVGHYEHIVLEFLWRVVSLDGRFTYGLSQQEVTQQASLDEGWGVEEAQKANSKDNATIWTQLALAYAIHKSFIFLRIPATIAVTPKVVKTLRGWGWNVGRMPTKGKHNV